MGNHKESILHLLEFVLKNNYFEFGKSIYLQKSGLTMGTACVPAVANIYCAVHETEMSKTSIGDLISFYGRYIDDIFVILQGEKEEVDLFTSLWGIPELNISWEVSQISVHFLDVQISLHEGKLVTDLHEKGLNKHMYIPFSSAHPLSVEKGMVKAERTRYRMVCYEEDPCKKAERNLEAQPVETRLPQISSGQMVSVDLKPREREDQILLLPSQYNPVWGYINVKKLEEAFWSQVYKDPTKVYLRKLLGELTVGLKRGWNMYGLYNRSNLAVLDTMASFGEI